MTDFTNINPDMFYNYGISPRQRRVFVLRWNPTISSFKTEDFEKLMNQYTNILPTDDDEDNYMDWTVWEWEKVNHRDLFVMMLVGQELNGIVWSGFLGGFPYQYEFKDGTKSKSHYFETTIQFMQRIEKSLLLTADKLIEAIPEVNWLHGHSGELISIESAEKLGLLMFNELRKAKESEDIFYDTYNGQKYVLTDLLTFMCPKLKKRLLIKGKNRSHEITDINNLMVDFDDNEFERWDNYEEHLYLKELDDVLM